jgi:hypothetical protein
MLCSVMHTAVTLRLGDQSSPRIDAQIWFSVGQIRSSARAAGARTWPLL